MKLTKSIVGARVTAPTEDMRAQAATMGTEKLPRRSPPNMASAVKKPREEEYLELVARAYANAIMRFDDLAPSEDRLAFQNAVGKVIRGELSKLIDYQGDTQRRSRDKRAIVYLWSQQTPPNRVVPLGREPGTGLEAWAEAGSKQRPIVSFEFGNHAYTQCPTPYFVEVRAGNGANKQVWRVDHKVWADQIIAALTKASKRHPELVKAIDPRQPSGIMSFASTVVERRVTFGKPTRHQRRRDDS